MNTPTKLKSAKVSSFAEPEQLFGPLGLIIADSRENEKKCFRMFFFLFSDKFVPTRLTFKMSAYISVSRKLACVERNPFYPTMRKI